MNSYSLIEQKIQDFIKKYYTSRLVKGVILFLAIGLLYFIATLLFEYFLWLSPIYRSILLGLFIAVELGLVYYFIGIPLFKLTGLQKRISKDEASKIIGNHFPEVSDKLTNLLQLKKDSQASELLEASINQKAKILQTIPFKLAVNLSSNKKYIKYLALPLLIFLLFQITGNLNIIGDSYTRVMNPTVAYTPPAPFHFIIKNDDLRAIENIPFILQVSTKGKVAPSDVKIHFKNESYYLKPVGINNFEYEFSNLNEPLQFTLEANDLSSPEYTIHTISVPSITNFSMELNYPAYVGKKNQVISNTGNAIVPEGTIINWILNTKTTDAIQFKTKDTVFNLIKVNSKFSFNHKVFSDLDYELSTHNNEIPNYEQLAYSIDVVKDEYPEIQVQSKADSLDNQTIYFLGKISDDYGLKKLQLIYNQVDSNLKQSVNLPINKGNFDQFSYVFPNNLNLEQGKAYEYYFEVTDNDVLHGYKKSKSQLFTYQKLTDSELESQQLENQQETIDNLNKSLDKLEKQEKSLEELNQLNKEKNKLNWNDKNKMKQFLKRQEQQEQLMKKFNKDLQNNLDNFQKENQQSDPFKEELQKRLEQNEKELEKKEKLLDELKKLQDKIQQEELSKKLDKLSKQNKNDQKSLEQIVELTKRYYISKKFEKVAKDLEKLAKEQNSLSEKNAEENSKEKQEELNKQFSELQKDLEDLKKENEELKQPMKLEDNKELQKEINNEQQSASDNLEKKKTEKAKKNQKNSAQKMQEMSMNMQQQMQSSSDQQQEEDIHMLRQILDNLIHYSFDQENLLEVFKDINTSSLDFPNKLKKQYILKENFQHIDDSLFALSLRQPKIAEVITKEITDVHFNIDKSLERFADLKIYLGRSNQQYALTAANNLANLLSDILNQMQEQMNMPGLGQCDKPGGKGFQLSDIIQEQESLMQQMKKEKNGEKEGDNKGEGKPGEKGNPKNEQGQKPGDKPGGQQGTGNDGEENSELLFEIYKKQQDLKNQLSDILKQNGLEGKMNNLLDKMDKIQDDLLEKGFSDDVVKQMQQLKHELLNLDKAALEQGEENKREANTNKQQFYNNTQLSIPQIEQYFKEVEILNRQVLPLQPVYKKKVKEYFNNATD
ncbi:DUF4175 family protein [Pseudofulvibacter geojedonensis]|uniref:DUF4175 family protein n=1 Tax=Pseudofulvibacter geojedonensis TaxID=1123758 RepID=A0ABW3I4A7_9FLAO